MNDIFINKIQSIQRYTYCFVRLLSMSFAKPIFRMLNYPKEVQHRNSF